MRRRIPLMVAAVAALAVLAAGCGGGGRSSTTAATTTVEYGKGAAAGALAFARCMRSHGIPGWPDPDSNGAFDKSKLVQLGVEPSRVRAIEERSCHSLFENGGPAQSITAADKADYLKAAACMRSHGFPAFPDPTFTDGKVDVSVPPGIDQDSPRFKSAAETCTKLIPTGLPYSGSTSP
jgi:hypothetical protein